MERALLAVRRLGKMWSFPRLDYLSLEWLSLGVEAGGRRRMRVDDRAGTRSEKRGGARSMRMRRAAAV